MGRNTTLIHFSCRLVCSQAQYTQIRQHGRLMNMVQGYQSRLIATALSRPAPGPTITVVPQTGQISAASLPSKIVQSKIKSSQQTRYANINHFSAVLFRGRRVTRNRQAAQGPVCAHILRYVGGFCIQSLCGMPGPARVIQHTSGQGDHIGLA